MTTFESSLISNRTLGWRMGLRNMLSKENLAWWHTRRWWVRFSQGRIAFRTPPSGKLNLRVGGLIVSSSRPLQSANGSVPGVPMSGETIGILSLSPEGALTVKNHQGNLYILNQERVVLASLSSRESVMLPSVTVKSPPRVMVAQVGEAGGYYVEEELMLLRMTVTDWLQLFAAWAAFGGIVTYALSQSGDDNIPICP